MKSINTLKTAVAGLNPSEMRKLIEHHAIPQNTLYDFRRGKFKDPRPSTLKKIHDALVSIGRLSPIAEFCEEASK